MRIVSIVSTVLLTLSLVSCATDDPQEIETDAATTSSNTTLTGADFFDGVAAAQAKHSSAHTHLEVSADGDTFSMSGPVTWGTESDLALDIASKSSQRSSTIQMVMVGRDFYIKGRQGFPEAKYIRFDLSDTENEMRKQGAFFERQLSPSGFLEELKQKGATVTLQGDGPVVDGVKTSEWRVTADPEALDALSEAIQVGTSLDMTLRLGDDNLLRQIEVPISGGTLIQTWSEWGEEHPIAPPKKSETLNTAQSNGSRAGS